MPIAELPPVAKSFLMACKKCDAERYHKVLAHVDSKAAKVQCEVCGGKSTYKLPSAKTAAASAKKSGDAKRVGAPSGGRGAAAAAKAKLNHEAEFDRLMGENSKTPMVGYSMKHKFDLNQRMNHPKFGEGLVRNVQIDKIEVVFRDEVRLLIHNRV